MAAMIATTSWTTLIFVELLDSSIIASGKLTETAQSYPKRCCTIEKVWK
jgi:hypothetical protein